MWDEVPGAFSANGYEGQYLIVVPQLDLVVVRLGKTVAELMALSERTNRTKFRDQVMALLLAEGLLERTIPEKPRSSKQTV